MPDQPGWFDPDAMVWVTPGPNGGLHMEPVLDEWLDHDEGVRVIKTARGYIYDPIRKGVYKRN